MLILSKLLQQKFKEYFIIHIIYYKMINQNFNFISDASTRSMVSNGHEAITELELWEWMKCFEPADDEGFMWTTHPNIHKIRNKMESLPTDPCHSGASFSLTIKHLKFIAKHGIPKYREHFYGKLITKSQKA
jgi:hypothetical protein